MMYDIIVLESLIFFRPQVNERPAFSKISTLGVVFITCDFGGWCHKTPKIYRGRISSVRIALDCRAGGREIDFRGATNSQGLKMLRNEGSSFALQAGKPSRGSDDRVKWRSRLQLETKNSEPK